MRRKRKRLATSKLIKLLLPSIGLILLTSLLAPHHVLSARGRQFKGILPPKEQKVEIVTEEKVVEKFAEPVYPQISMVINIPARQVVLYDEGKEVYRHSIAVGEPRYKTPPGPMEVNTIIWNPWWIPPDSPWARGAKKQPPGPKNVLGPVKLMMEKGIRLHGTNNNSSIGRATSHGCLRMLNNEVADMAWYIQKRINNAEDPLLEKYRKHRSTSFYVNLTTPLYVDIIYKPVEIIDDFVYIYKDIYGWAGEIKKEVLNAIMHAGIDTKKVNAERISKLKYPTGLNHVDKIKLKKLLTSDKADEELCLDIVEIDE